MPGSRRRASGPDAATGRSARREGSLRDVLVPLVRPERKRLSLIAVSSVLGGLAEAALLVLLARIAFAIASDHSSITVSFGPIDGWRVSVPELLAFAAGFVAVRMVLQAIQTVLAARVTFAAVCRVRKTLVNRYLGASWALQAQQRDGRLQELLTTYAGATSGALNVVTQGSTACFSLLALLGTALAVNPLASVGAAAAALVVGLVLRPMRLAARRRSARAATANLEFATAVTELTSTLQEVRIFEVERPVGDRMGRLADESGLRQMHTAYLSGAISVLYQGLAMFILVGALAIAYGAGFSDLPSLGAVVLIMLRSLTYAQNIQGSFQSLHVMAPMLETLAAEDARYAQAAVRRDGDPIAAIGTLSFDDVTFEYEPGRPVLRHVSFTVPKGEIVGIVGPSGAGKSTLVQILLRLREPTDGTVRTDGHDVRELSLDDWYEHVTFVPQEARLFAGTVADNIRFFRDDLDESALERAAKRAHLHEEIASWPLGYDTPVGERGGQLSGGQRQRLCIARALVEDPDVFVLDEPTSSLDIRSDALLRETLADVAPHSSVFVIAHRLSTLSICDRIMVILDGEMQGFDDPVTLEASNPFYREALRLSGMR